MAQLFVRSQKSLLDDIFGVLFIPGHPEGQPEYTPAMAFDEDTKRVAIARLRSNDCGAVAFFHLAFRLERLLAGSFESPWSFLVVRSSFSERRGRGFDWLCVRSVRFAFFTFWRILPAKPEPTQGFARKKKGVAQAITRDPETMHGIPVFRGTRVPVQTLFDYLEGGDTLDDFLEGFPTVSRALAVEAIEEAKQLLLAHT